MNNTMNDFAKQGQGSTSQGAEMAAEKAKGGIDQTVSSLSDKVDSVRKQAQPVLDKVSEVASQVRDQAAQASESLMTYTQENPVKALLFAAAAGAVLMTLSRALTPSRH